MNILIVTATEQEIAPFKKVMYDEGVDVTNKTKLIILFTYRRKNKLTGFKFKEHNIEILVTGPGMMNTSYHLSKILALKTYDLVLNVGIAGSFNQDLVLGQVVNVTSDQYGDFGAEDGPDFISAWDIPILARSEYPYTGRILKNTTSTSDYFDLISDLDEVSAITVNKAHGNSATIEVAKKMFSADVETMEGLAFAHACKMDDIPFAQIRAISNYVTLRDKSTWQVKKAITNLHDFLYAMFEEGN